RHSTEPNKPIIQLNIQGEVTILPKTYLVRNVFSDLNRTFNYNSNNNYLNLNTSILASPLKTVINSDRKNKENRMLNHTFADNRMNDNGFAFLNTAKNKPSNKFKSIYLQNSTTSNEVTSVNRNLNESFNRTLKSVKSSDNLSIFRKNVEILLYHRESTR